MARGLLARLRKEEKSRNRRAEVVDLDALEHTPAKRGVGGLMCTGRKQEGNGCWSERKVKERCINC